jgi:predicted double-glycine peptidase
MTRIARIVVPGVPHHVTQRGNRGERVFLALRSLRCITVTRPHFPFSSPRATFTQ